MNGSIWNASSCKPAQLFEGRLFYVPDYQRGYAWEEEQLKDFLEDLELLPAGSVHYTGNIVLHCRDGRDAKDKHGKSYDVYDVVDGQQRLTTFVLLLAAIREELMGLGEHDLAEGIYSTYIAVPDRDGQPLAKVTLNSDCHRFFFDSVLHGRPHLDGGRIRSHRNLDFAKKYFLKFLINRKQVMKAAYRDWLEELRHKICEQLVLTVYPVQQDADAGVIFEVMNNRGKPITELEKAKNYLLFLASKLPATQDLCKQVNDAWSYIFTKLMSAGCCAERDENQLLRAHWLMAFNPEEKEWDGCKSIKDRFHLRKCVGAYESLRGELSDYVRTLRYATASYCDIVNPEHPDAFDGLAEGALRREVIEAAEKLPRLNIVAPFVPLLTAIRIRHQGNWGLYVESLKYCELYAFRVYRLLQRRSSAGRRELVRLANSLYAGRKGPAAILSELRALIKKFSRDAGVKESFAFDPDMNWYEWTGIKYFLYEYESHLAKKQNKDQVTWKEVERLKHSIEHILPQEATHAYWRQRWNRFQRHKYTNDIGNLCLTRDNSAYGNKPFPEKRGDVGSDQPCYANGNFIMERRLATTYPEWTEQSLLERRAQIMAWAKVRWGLSTPRASEFDWRVQMFRLKWQFDKKSPT